MDKKSIAAIILAGGESRRMDGTPKANLHFGAKTFLRVITDKYSRCGIKIIYVILGKHYTEIKEKHTEMHTVFLKNENYELGQLSSIQIGINSLPEYIEAVIIHPVDQPLVKDTTIDDILEAAESENLIILPKFSGKRGHPVLFKKQLFPQLLTASPDVGAREVVWNNRGKVEEIATDDTGVTVNINTRALYKQYIGGGSSESL